MATTTIPKRRTRIKYTEMYNPMEQQPSPAEQRLPSTATTTSHDTLTRSSTEGITPPNETIPKRCTRIKYTELYPPQQEQEPLAAEQRLPSISTTTPSHDTLTRNSTQGITPSTKTITNKRCTRIRYTELYPPQKQELPSTSTTGPAHATLTRNSTQGSASPTKEVAIIQKSTSDITDASSDLPPHLRILKRRQLTQENTPPTKGSEASATNIAIARSNSSSSKEATTTDKASFPPHLKYLADFKHRQRTQENTPPTKGSEASATNIAITRSNSSSSKEATTTDKASLPPHLKVLADIKSNSTQNISPSTEESKASTTKTESITSSITKAPVTYKTATPTKEATEATIALPPHLKILANLPSKSTKSTQDNAPSTKELKAPTTQVSPESTTLSIKNALVTYKIAAPTKEATKAATDPNTLPQHHKALADIQHQSAQDASSPVEKTSTAPDMKGKGRARERKDSDTDSEGEVILFKGRGSSATPKNLSNSSKGASSKPGAMAMKSKAQQQSLASALPASTDYEYIEPVDRKPRQPRQPGWMKESVIPKAHKPKQSPWIKDSDIPKGPSKRRKPRFSSSDPKSSGAESKGWEAYGWDTSMFPDGGNGGLADWAGGISAPDIDWDSRPSYRARQSTENIENWIDATLATLKDPNPVRFTDGTNVPDALRTSDVAPRNWVPIRIDGMNADRHWIEILNSGQPPQPVDVNDLVAAQPWWNTYQDADLDILRPLEHPAIAGIDPEAENLKMQMFREHDQGGANAKLNRKTAVEKYRQQRRVNRLARLDQAHKLSGTSTTPAAIKPGVKLFLRSAEKEDMIPLRDIYNRWVENSVIVKELERITEKDMIAKWEASKAAKLPLIVACQRGERLKIRYGDFIVTPDRVIGFAMAKQRGDVDLIYHVTTELEIYVHLEFLQKKVASCLGDKMMGMLDPAFIERGGYETSGGDLELVARTDIKNVMVVCPFDPEAADELMWKRQWIKKHLGFKKMAGMRGVAEKFGKKLNLSVLNHVTGGPAATSGAGAMK